MCILYIIYHISHIYYVCILHIYYVYYIMYNYMYIIYYTCVYYIHKLISFFSAVFGNVFSFFYRSCFSLFWWCSLKHRFQKFPWGLPCWYSGLRLHVCLGGVEFNPWSGTKTLHASLCGKLFHIKSNLFVFLFCYLFFLISTSKKPGFGNLPLEILEF